MKETDFPRDVDEATWSLIEEMADLWEKMCDRHVKPIITEYNYKGHWGRMKESTSSALSKIHMGHWKAFLQSPELMDFESRTLTLIARSGIPPERWSRGLQVMLEKTEGVSLIKKLRFILLMEGDKNAYNRMLIGYKIWKKSTISPKTNTVNEAAPQKIQSWTTDSHSTSPSRC